MGGYNSGGGRGAMRQGQFWSLDIAVLKRLDMLRAGHSFNGSPAHVAAVRSCRSEGLTCSDCSNTPPARCKAAGASSTRWRKTKGLMCFVSLSQE
jgi:hypothetical protein